MRYGRDEVREFFATAYEPYAKLAQAVYDYKPTDAGGIFPFVAIESSGSEYEHRVFGKGLGRYGATYLYVVHHFVLFADENQKWTKRDAEKEIDKMAIQLVGFIADNQVTSHWKAIDISSASTIFDNIKVGGEQYIVEQFPLSVIAV